ncbi:hypothetical protein TDB9533_01298 [Thalassocella blandensis]|nr:hypothetical protein TDB9533_01298 [Thalassocella blandensis]
MASIFNSKWQFFRYLLSVLLRWSAVLFVAVFSLILILLSFALDDKPSLEMSTPITSSEAKTGSDFIKRISRKVINTHETIPISASEQEMDSVLHLIHRTYSGFIGKVNIQGKGAHFEFSVRTSVLGQPYYLNGKATLTSAKHGFHWEESQIGSIPLWDGMANKIFYRLVETGLGKSYGRKILNGISDIEIHPTKLTLSFKPPQGFQEGIANVVERLNSYYGSEKKFNPVRVQYYIDALVDFTRARDNTPVSLIDYLNFLLQTSAKQAAANNYSPAEENLSALYALGIQVGPGVFRHFVADIKLHRLNATAQPKLTLKSREDLAKHFVYSSALKILAEQGFSFSLGELKEILDANGGGSGFSFVDITADKVGIRFTEMAIGSELNATRLHEYAQKSLSENDIFPDIMALPEGLSEKEFKNIFSDLESDTYQGLLSEIDLRIGQTPLFKHIDSLSNLPSENRK